AGNQREKFLFYRGVSAVALPLSAKQNPDGQQFVRTLAADPIPALIYFERRGARVGYRLVVAPAAETLVAPPSLTSDVETLRADLESLLTQHGLYPDEAHAMVETWQDSWFEEGSRLIYLVPSDFLEKILPLSIDPKPEAITRVFIGRLEIITPAPVKGVEAAPASTCV